jgi:hypothetical protein
MLVYCGASFAEEFWPLLIVNVSCLQVIGRYVSQHEVSHYEVQSRTSPTGQVFG